MNIVYDNTVLEAKLTEILNSKLEVRSLMTVDDSLAEGAGLTKVINRYTYNGAMEELYGGQANSITGSVSFTPESYTVKRYQQTFRYNDVEAMQDPALIDVALAGAADVMANQLRTEYFEQLMRIKNRFGLAGDSLSYTDIVEALGNINREVEDGLFILMGADGRTAIRKDPDFIAAHQGDIVYSGQFGTLCGIPVLFSKLVPAGRVIITEKAAVKFFVKREANLEQSRDIETKDNTIVYERHGVIALVDDTSSVILGKMPEALEASGTLLIDATSLTLPELTGDIVSYRFAYDTAMPFYGDDASEWEWVQDHRTVAYQNEKSITVVGVDADGRVLAGAVITH